MHLTYMQKYFHLALLYEGFAFKSINMKYAFNLDIQKYFHLCNIVWGIRINLILMEILYSAGFSYKTHRQIIQNAEKQEEGRAKR